MQSGETPFFQEGTSAALRLVNQSFWQNYRRADTFVHRIKRSTVIHLRLKHTPQNLANLNEDSLVCSYKSNVIPPPPAKILPFRVPHKRIPFATKLGKIPIFFPHQLLWHCRSDRFDRTRLNRKNDHPTRLTGALFEQTLFKRR